MKRTPKKSDMKAYASVSLGGKHHSVFMSRLDEKNEETELTKALIFWIPKKNWKNIKPGTI